MRHIILLAPLRWLERVERDVNGFSGQRLFWAIGAVQPPVGTKRKRRALRCVATNLYDTSFNLLTTI